MLYDMVQARDVHLLRPDNSGMMHVMQVFGEIMVGAGGGGGSDAISMADASTMYVRPTPTPTPTPLRSLGVRADDFAVTCGVVVRAVTHCVARLGNGGCARRRASR